MPKTIQKRPISWDKLVQMALDIGDRYRVYKHKRSPFIHIIDRFNNNKKVSLKGLYVDVLEDRLLALKIVEHLGEETFPSINVVTLIERIRNDEAIDIAEHNTFDWQSLKECTENHVIKTMKGSSGKNVRATLNRIYEDKPEFKWEAILKWLKKKHTVDQRGFLNNLDSLEQIRLAYLGQKGVEPEWLTRELLLEQRSLHNQSKKKLNRYQNNTDMVDIRGIPTKKEAEKYFENIKDEFPLETWCLVMMMNYGLRNHELHHIEEITSDDPSKNMKWGWVYVAGEWRTKSKFEHWTFPIFPDWIEKYHLKDNFRNYQDLLRSKAKMNIVSALDKTKKWDKSIQNDRGVCDNNSYLGNWITKRMKAVLPIWKARVPDSNGIRNKKEAAQPIKPYDLRHTWAITVATESKWSKISDVEAAQAMGHDISTHKKHYQRWISSEAKRSQVMSTITF